MRRGLFAGLVGGILLVVGASGVRGVCGEAPAEATAVAKKAVSESSNLDADAKAAVLDVVARVESSPGVKVPYVQMSPWRRDRFRQTLVGWIEQYPPQEFRTELQKRAALDRLEANLKGFFFIPAYRPGPDIDRVTSQIKEVRALVTDGFRQKILALFPEAEKTKLIGNLGDRVAFFFPNPVEDDLSPVFGRALSDEKFADLKRAVGQQMEKMRIEDKIPSWLKAQYDAQAPAGRPSLLDTHWAMVLGSLSGSISEATASLGQAYYEPLAKQVKDEYSKAVGSKMVDGKLQKLAFDEMTDMQKRQIEERLKKDREEFDRRVAMVKVKPQEQEARVPPGNAWGAAARLLIGGAGLVVLLVLVAVFAYRRGRGHSLARSSRPGDKP